ncbi:hypothetical protein M408DRAFT_298976 [Serendipita vermifera MAFF 305830]|uniref:PNPLA domain-containing protein n=1 Tax=Serendipita vermifera MAFF 305830 TaxID=933852 RepID=A0A0C3ARS5_SERVB|nr:hypothetical protein M408DRAFT_117391 [Serendipita vermifera MAFF 305830]KIM21976.1 hypothetical protein M408DRAFT_298976 [Serendipita vermifera MAFF 305830]
MSNMNMPALDPSAEPLRILALDGGDLRVISQMVILEELMGRVAQDRKEDSVLPCNYFHMITGTGAGGLLAILLGVLDLSIERALEEFIGIYNRVVDASLTPSARSEMLEAWMTDLLERSNLPKNQPLMGTGTCPT